MRRHRAAPEGESGVRLAESAAKQYQRSAYLETNAMYNGAMEQLDEMPNIQIAQSRLNMDDLLESFATDPAFAHQLQQAKILIIPTDLGPERREPTFPETTRDVFDLLRARLGADDAVEAAVRDEDYVEFAFRSEEVILPVLYFAEHVLIPGVVGLLASYLKDSFGRKRELDDTTVDSEFHFEDEDQLLSVQYKGPASTYEEVMLKALAG